MALSRTQVTVMLGIAQTLSWASSYYLLAVLARPISQSTSTSYSLVFGAFSAALLVAAAVGPIAGRLIDRFGGRSVLLASNLVFACGLLMLSQATQTLHIFVAWAFMGVAMGSGLYEAAFLPESRFLLALPAPWAGRFPAIWKVFTTGASYAFSGPLCTCCSAFRSMPCYRVPSPTRGKWLKNKSRLELSLRAETTQASVLSALPI